MKKTTKLIAGVALVALVVFFLTRRRGGGDDAAKHPPLRTHALLIDDAATLIELETRGLGFDRIVGAARLDFIARTVARDMEEFTRGQPKNSPRRPFKPEWLTPARAQFELVGVVNRIDRRRFDPLHTCGETRLVYRLAIKNAKRPVARLPMTVNVRIPQAKPTGNGDCAEVAARWREGIDLEALIKSLPSPSQIEINFQSIHTPGAQQDMDDSAEYVLRSFEVEKDGALRVGLLFNTPKPDVDKTKLAQWIAASLPEIDAARATLPDALLAERVVSTSPRGLVHLKNRSFSSLFSADDFKSLPLDALTVAKTPQLLLRRLDETTCVGCHQTRSVAGFHLLGEDRGDSTFNTLAVGHSPHLAADLIWRETDLENAAKGGHGQARPFAAFPHGGVGSECGLVPGLASWSCREGLICRDIHHSDVGVCVKPGGGAEAGDPCQDVTVASSTRLEGPIVTASAADPTCPAPSGAQRTGKFCAPNWLGFTGGVCSERCSKVGTQTGSAICAAVPAAGYEADCFLSEEPVESCLKRHLVQATVASCDASHPCRDDYGCARVQNAPKGVGACVPPYFIFQARVDGPRLDR